MQLIVGSQTRNTSNNLFLILTKLVTKQEKYKGESISVTFAFDDQDIKAHKNAYIVEDKSYKEKIGIK